MDLKSLVGDAGGSGTLLGSQSNAVGGAMLGDAGCLPSLTFQQRIIGFGSCFALGMLISFLSTLNLLNPVSFASLYSFGNMLALMSTGFLVGPVKQCKNMFHQKRIWATLIYLVILIITLVVAFSADFGGKTIFMIVLIICQFLALTWYTLSYIPFARDLVKQCFASRFSSGGA
jgi:Got1/Sft2-like family